MTSQYVQRGMTVVAGLLVVLFVTAAAALLGGFRPRALGVFGIPGVFLIMLLSSGSIFLPIPGLPAVAAAGAIWNPLLVGLAGALWSATGELTGYAAGIAGQAALNVESRSIPSWLSWLETGMLRYGFWIILILAMIPNPAFDAVGILAGVQRYPLRRFWIACFLGKLGKCVAVAYLGESARWLVRE
jgi:uncharacterized membrane protein YdjX (TVP38/TMEM64 family)